MLLGAGRNAVADLGIETIAAARHFAVTDVTVLPGHDDEHHTAADQTNVRITMRGN